MLLLAFSTIITVHAQSKKDLNELNMYFNRPEFDRYTRFNSWGSAREPFDWDSMCDIEMDLPNLDIPFILTVIKAFSELDLDPTTYDSIKMGYIFENLIGRFYQNVDAGQFYTGRDIIKLLDHC